MSRSDTVVLGDQVSRSDIVVLGDQSVTFWHGSIRGSECHVPTPGIRGSGVMNRHVVVGDRSVTFRHRDSRGSEYHVPTPGG